MDGINFACFGCIFDSNFASENGGGLRLHGYTAFFSIDGGIFRNNSVADGSVGAALDFEPNSPTANGRLARMLLEQNKGGNSLVRLLQPVKWKCQLGKYGTPTGTFVQNFESCPNPCSRGYYGDTPDEDSPTCTALCVPPPAELMDA